MSNISFSCEWLAAGQDPLHLRETSAQLTVRVNDISLTQNEDVWSKTVRDSVLVSAYPLAMWMATSWWRLNYEPLSKHGVLPPTDWRLAHEIGAANSGYVWPHMVFAPDGEVIQIWAIPSNPNSKQSVRYLTGLPTHISVGLASFQSAVDDFVGSVISRLRAVDQANTDLANLWALIREDRNNPEQAKLRRLEAQLGFDPEECPDSIMAAAVTLEKRMGLAAMSELAPVYGRRGHDTALGDLANLVDAQGVQGCPEIKRGSVINKNTTVPPWRRAVESARDLRQQINNPSEPIGDSDLYGLLGLKADAVDAWSPNKRQQVGLAIPDKQGKMRFVYRKRHPIAKRFEFARFLADYVSSNDSTEGWLTSTDLSTSRQKFQRAFSAEFLCPINALAGFLGGDFSEAAIEEAATHYSVSEETVKSLLANNGYIAPPITDGSLPYRARA